MILGITVFLHTIYSHLYACIIHTIHTYLQVFCLHATACVYYGTYTQICVHALASIYLYEHKYFHTLRMYILV
jgi:hypothetical protein